MTKPEFRINDEFEMTKFEGIRCRRVTFPMQYLGLRFGGQTIC